MSSKYEKLLEAGNASEITSALKECGNGDMKNGVFLLIKEARSGGLVEGREQMVIAGSFLLASGWAIKTAYNKLVQWHKEKKEHVKNEKKLVENIEKGIEKAKQESCEDAPENEDNLRKEEV